MDGSIDRALFSRELDTCMHTYIQMDMGPHEDAKHTIGNFFLICSQLYTYICVSEKTDSRG